MLMIIAIIGLALAAYFPVFALGHHHRWTKVFEKYPWLFWTYQLLVILIFIGVNDQLTS